MREIKFRGQRTDNREWVYGSLIQSQQSYKYGKNTISSNCWIKEENEDVDVNLFLSSGSIVPDCTIIQVDPETVGQYTGLKDIYEGDLFHIGDPNILYVVEWFDTGLSGRQLGNKSRVGLEHWQSKIQVIGNIHENPELLK